MNYETTSEIERAVVGYFNVRKFLIVPNVSWGLGFNDRELDLAILTNSNYLYEVEIKISLSDLKKDKEKRHQHKSDWIKRLWFAVPEKLQKHIEHIPEFAGILIVDNFGRVREIRSPKDNKTVKKLPDKMRYKLARLGTLRMWRLYLKQ